MFDLFMTHTVTLIFNLQVSGLIRREYDLKCRMLRLQDSRAESPNKIDKTRAVVKDLHSRIRVAIHRISSISKIIEELRDKELQPQLEELIGGYTPYSSHHCNFLFELFKVGRHVFLFFPKKLHAHICVFFLFCLASSFEKKNGCHQDWSCSRKQLKHYLQLFQSIVFCFQSF